MLIDNPEEIIVDQLQRIMVNFVGEIDSVKCTSAMYWILCWIFKEMYNCLVRNREGLIEHVICVDYSWYDESSPLVYTYETSPLQLLLIYIYKLV